MRPSYVYSVGSSLVLVDIDVDGRHPDIIRAWPRVVVSDRARVQALTTHVKHSLVYFSDTHTGAIYRTNRDSWDVTEITVQQPHVEGKQTRVYSLLALFVSIVNSYGLSAVRKYF